MQYHRQISSRVKRGLLANGKITLRLKYKWDIKRIMRKQLRSQFSPHNFRFFTLIRPLLRLWFLLDDLIRFIRLGGLK